MLSLKKLILFFIIWLIWKVTHTDIITEKIKLKNSKYGLEIVKSDSTNEENIEVTNMIDITDNEEKIDKVLNDLVIKEITPDSSDVIEDLLKIHAC